MRNHHLGRFSSIAVFLLLLHCCDASAAFAVDGPVTGNVCHGFGIKICGPHVVEAIKVDGTLYNVPRSFKSVDSFSSGQCRIDVKVSESTIFGLAADALRRFSFYEKTTSGLDKIEVDRLNFPCHQTD